MLKLSEMQIFRRRLLSRDFCRKEANDRARVCVHNAVLGHALPYFLCFVEKAHQQNLVKNKTWCDEPHSSQPLESRMDGWIVVV